MCIYIYIYIYIYDCIDLEAVRLQQARGPRDGVEVLPITISMTSSTTIITSTFNYYYYY